MKNWIWLLGAALVGVCATSGAADRRLPAKPVPTDRPALVEVQHAFQAAFRDLPGYRPGGLITRSEAAAALDRVAATGWIVPDRAAILAATVADDDPLARLLRSERAASFAAQVSRQSGGYDRLDHLMRLPRGTKITAELARQPGGAKMIEYLAGTPGGQELGQMLSKSPRGAQFNRPTGRIYTAEALFQRLQVGSQPDSIAVPGAAAGR